MDVDAMCFNFLNSEVGVEDLYRYVLFDELC